MAYTPKTYIDLFGTEAEAITFYKNLFLTTQLSDDDIKNFLNISFNKIEPIFGEFRAYIVGEDTKRNYDIKKAVGLEANSIAEANKSSVAGANVAGGLNTNIGGNSNITEEKIGNITTKYGKGASGGLGGLSDRLVSELGLLSMEASLLLSRYIRKTYGWAS